MLFDTTDLSLDNVFAIFDNDKQKTFLNFRGIEIFSPEEIAEKEPDYIIISSKSNQGIIYSQLSDIVPDKTKVIRLY